MSRLHLAIVLAVLISIAIAKDLVKEDDDGPDQIVHATNKTSVPSMDYIVDAVNCLKEAYSVYGDDNDRAKLYSELFHEKHPQTEWNVVVGYTTAYIKSKWYIETSVGEEKNLKKGKDKDKDKDKNKENLYLLFSKA